MRYPLRYRPRRMKGCGRSDTEVCALDVAGLLRDKARPFWTDAMTDAPKKHEPLVFSGMQPTNTLHLGNYLGALKNWVKLQERMPCIYCVVDMHALTVE